MANTLEEPIFPNDTNGANGSNGHPDTVPTSVQGGPDHGGLDVAVATAPTIPVSVDAVTKDQLEIRVAELQAQIEKATKRSWLSRIWVSFKILIVLALLAAGAVAGYFGWEYYKDEVRDPIDSNTAALATVSGADGERVATIEEQITALEGRVNALDTTAAESLPGQIEELADRTTELEALQTTLQDLVDEHTENIDDINTAQQELSAAATSGLDATKATALLSRARLFLYQANYGLAAADIAAAQGLVAEIASTDALTESELKDVSDRLDRATAALPDRPVLAADEVDIAWAALVADTELTPIETDSATPTEPEAEIEEPAAETSQPPAESGGVAP